jgi:hypothetical protein
MGLLGNSDEREKTLMPLQENFSSVRLEVISFNERLKEHVSSLVGTGLWGLGSGALVGLLMGAISLFVYIVLLRQELSAVGKNLFIFAGICAVWGTLVGVKRYSLPKSFLYNALLLCVLPLLFDAHSFFAYLADHPTNALMNLCLGYIFYLPSILATHLFILHFTLPYLCQGLQSEKQPEPQLTG